MPPTDPKWTHARVQRVIAGEPAAVREFVRDLGAWIRGVTRAGFLSQGHTVEDADDFLQDFVIELFQDQGRVLREWDPQGASLRTFLSRRIYFRLMDAYRRRRRQLWHAGDDDALLQNVPAEPDPPDDRIDLSERMEWVWLYLSDADKHIEKVIFEHVILDGNPMQDLAERLDLTTDALYQRKRRLIVQLRLLWQNLEKKT